MGGQKGQAGAVELLVEARISLDYGPSDLWRHKRFGQVTTERGGALVARDESEHLVDSMFLLGLLSRGAHEAGLRFKRDYMAAGMERRLTANYSSMGRVSGGGGASWDERSDAQEAAYARWRRAFESLPGREGKLAVSVLCYDLKLPGALLKGLAGALSKLEAYYEALKQGPARATARLSAIREDLEKESALGTQQKAPNQGARERCAGA